MATQTQKINRRGFLALSASSAALAALPSHAHKPLQHWRGILLGAEVQLQIAHEHPQKAQALLARCVGEIQRLETIFTLYDTHSELSHLNRNGALTSPSTEMVEIMQMAQQFHNATNGRFDITMRPLETPSRQATIGMKHLHVSGKRIAFAKPNMQATLNGIAQGYITDKITELLKHEGLRNVLVQLGENRALNTHPSGRDWQLQLAGTNAALPLRNNALAVSSTHSPNTGKPHIYNPHTGKAGATTRTLAVIADNAAKADAMATGLILLEKNEAERIARTEGLTLIYV